MLLVFPLHFYTVNAIVLVDSLKLGHLALTQLEIEDLCVLEDARWSDTLWQHNNITLYSPS